MMKENSKLLYVNSSGVSYIALNIVGCRIGFAEIPGMTVLCVKNSTFGSLLIVTRNSNGVKKLVIMIFPIYIRSESVYDTIYIVRKARKNEMEPLHRR